MWTALMFEKKNSNVYKEVFKKHHKKWNVEKLCFMLYEWLYKIKDPQDGGSVNDFWLYHLWDSGKELNVDINRS